MVHLYSENCAKYTEFKADRNSSNFALFTALLKPFSNPLIKVIMDFQ